MTNNEERKAALLEICVDDMAGLEAAIAGGADRIELCAALSIGGLTPGPGFMELAAAAPIPVNALIRPRAGGFCYRPDEIRQMRRDIAAARRAGLAGVVIGLLGADGRLEKAGMADLIAEAEGMDITLHRAFDLTPDLEEALDDAMALGIPRVLTSGGCRHAGEGRDRLAALALQAAGRISVMPGGGVTPALAADFLRNTPIREVHASGTCVGGADDPRLVEFGFLAAGSRQTDVETVRALKQAVSAY